MDSDNHADFGTGQKKLGLYLIGFISCSILTLIAFWTVLSARFSKWEVFIIIYAAACIQFFVQVVCFLRLTTKTEQGKSNIMAFVFTGVILVCIILGSVWIMANLYFYTMH